MNWGTGSTHTIAKQLGITQYRVLYAVKQNKTNVRRRAIFSKLFPMPEKERDSVSGGIQDKSKPIKLYQNGYRIIGGQIPTF